jgi:hypothetical protein
MTTIVSADTPNHWETARWHRRCYRLSGILVILLGGALPILASNHFTGKDLLVALIGFAVATITALRGFYRWDSGWVLMRETEFILTKRYMAWKALQVTEPAPEVLRKETSKLLADLVAIREKEARSFFKELPLPAKDSESRTAAGEVAAMN